MGRQEPSLKGAEEEPSRGRREQHVGCAPSELDVMWERQGGQCVEPHGQGEAGIRGWPEGLDAYALRGAIEFPHLLWHLTTVCCVLLTLVADYHSHSA